MPIYTDEYEQRFYQITGDQTNIFNAKEVEIYGFVCTNKALSPINVNYNYPCI